MNKLGQDSMFKDIDFLKKLIEISGGRREVVNRTGVAMRTIESWMAGDRHPSTPVAFALMALAGLKLMLNNEDSADAASVLLDEIEAAMK